MHFSFLMAWNPKWFKSPSIFALTLTFNSFVLVFILDLFSLALTVAVLMSEKSMKSILFAVHLVDFADVNKNKQ